MQMCLVSIIVCFTHFPITSAHDFNTVPTNTQRDSTETTQTSNQEPNPRLKTTLLTTSEANTINLPSPTQETATRRPFENDTAHEDGPSDAMNHTRLMKPDETMSNASYDNEPTLQQTTTPEHRDQQDVNPSTLQRNNIITQSDMMDHSVSTEDASNAATRLKNTTVSTDFRRFTSENHEQLSSTISDHTGSTFKMPALFNSGTTSGLWKEEKATKAKSISNQTPFANTHDDKRETLGATQHYSITNKHKEELYDTESTPMITPVLTPSQQVTMVTEYPMTKSGEQRENVTGTNTIHHIVSDTSTHATTSQSNTIHTSNKASHTCFNQNPGPNSRHSRMVCFITLWTLAMTATIFLGVNIFLYVRLSIVKKRARGKEKRGHKSEKETLWADPKASVQDRVEFWYVNGSTMEADKKEKDRERQEKMKRRREANDENSLWIQPRVTVDDITGFWYSNRRTTEERTQDM